MRPKCTKELIAEAVKLKKTGMSNKDMCSCLGINEATLYKWLGDPKTPNHVELSKALKKTEGEFKAALRMRIIKKSSENWQAAAWMLERMYPDEYARPEIQLAQRAAEEAADKTAQRFEDVLVKIRETAENDDHRADS